MAETEKATGQTYYGEDCPKGMVQVQFVGTPAERYSKYGWKPAESAFLELYVDGQRYRVDMGTFHDGSGNPRRGLTIIGPLGMVVDHHSINGVDLFVPGDPDHG